MRLAIGRSGQTRRGLFGLRHGAKRPKWEFMRENESKWHKRAKVGTRGREGAERDAGTEFNPLANVQVEGCAPTTALDGSHFGRLAAPTLAGSSHASSHFARFAPSRFQMTHDFPLWAFRASQEVACGLGWLGQPGGRTSVGRSHATREVECESGGPRRAMRRWGGASPLQAPAALPYSTPSTPAPSW